MKKFFNNLEIKFQRFMYGRYGVDQLYRALIWIYFICAILSMIIGRLTNTTVYYILFAASTAILIFTFFRVFSKNTQKRRAENYKWLQFIGRIKKQFQLLQNRWKFRKTHIFRKCPNCKAVLRMKRVKGKHRATCPHCSQSFNFRVLF